MKTAKGARRAHDRDAVTQIITAYEERPAHLSAWTIARLLNLQVDDKIVRNIVRLVIDAIASGRLIVHGGVTPEMFKSVTDPERRQELVKAICLRNIRQGDSK